MEEATMIRKHLCCKLGLQYMGRFVSFILVIVTFIMKVNTGLANEDSISSIEKDFTKPTVLVVTPPIFDSALQPWIHYRQSQGYDVFLLPLCSKNPDGSIDMGVQTRPVTSPEEIRNKILKVSKGRQIEAIVLVGDGAPTQEAKYGWRDIVPAARVETSIIPVFGGEDYLATDSFYADFDNDGFADVPIGRFPVETSEELQGLVAKIIRYENSSPVGNWVRRINIVAGPNGLDLRVIGSRPGDILEEKTSLGGLSALVDSIINNMARKLFSDYLPQEFSLSLTQCSPQSVFCPYPPDFGDTFLKRINEGSLFFIYMGHGRVLGLDRFKSSKQEYGIFEIDDSVFLNNSFKSPIAFFFACYTGAYDANCVSLAEKVALSPNGPVAVYAASRLTAPYGMCVLGASLLETAFLSDFSGVEDEPKLLGRIILESQKNALASIRKESNGIKRDEISEEFFFETNHSIESQNVPIVQLSDDTSVGEWDEHLQKINKRLEKGLKQAEETKRKNSSFRKMLDRSAAIFDPTAARLDDQIKEHILEFNLLGDPLLRIKLPQRIEFNSPDISYSSKEIEVSGCIPNLNDKESLIQAELLLANFRSSVKKPLRNKPFAESSEAKTEFSNTYSKANNFVVDAVRTTTKNGSFQIRIIVPEDYSGESIIRIAAYDGENYYIGSRKVLVRPFSGGDND